MKRPWWQWISQGGRREVVFVLIYVVVGGFFLLSGLWIHGC